MHARRNSIRKSIGLRCPHAVWPALVVDHAVLERRRQWLSVNWKRFIAIRRILGDTQAQLHAVAFVCAGLGGRACSLALESYGLAFYMISAAHGFQVREKSQHFIPLAGIPSEADPSIYAAQRRRGLAVARR